MKKETGFNRLKTVKIALIASLALILAVITLTFVLAVNNVRRRSSALLFAEGYIKEMTSAELCEVLNAYVSENITQFESVEDVKSKIEELIKKEELSLFRHKDYTEKNPVFTVCFGAEELFTLKLKANSFPIKNGYEAKELKVSESISLGNDLILNLPAHSILTVNGITVERAKADPDIYCDLSEFEKSLSDSIISDRYVLGRFFFSPDISVVYEGNRLGAGSIIDGSVHYHYPASMTESYTFSIPVGATLKINGASVGEEYITEKNLKYAFISKYEDRLPGIPTAVDYQVSGLFNAPEVEVEYNGVILEEENGSYKLPDSMTKTVVIAVPDYATLKINGITVSSENITKRKEELPILAGVTGYAKERPYLTEYTVSGLFLTPTVEVTDEEGNPLAIDTLNSTEDRTVYCCTASEVPDSVLNNLKNYVTSYAKYFYSGSNGMGDNFYNATKYTPYSSLAYANLKDTYSDLYNSTVYKNLSFGEMVIDSFVAYSESAYSAIITLPLSGTLNDQTHELTLKIELLCTFSGSRRWINYRVISH